MQKTARYEKFAISSPSIRIFIAVVDLSDGYADKRGLDAQSREEYDHRQFKRDAFLFFFEPFAIIPR